MSQENVEIVRRLFELSNAADMGGLTALHAPDVVLRGPEGWPETGPWRGRDAVMGQNRRLREDFGEQTLVIEEIAAHEDWVLVRQEWRVRGGRSGINVEFKNTVTYRLRAGRVVEIRFYWTHDEALEAVGLGA